MNGATTCPECRGASLETANDHAATTGCRSYRVTRGSTLPLTPSPRPAAWLAAHFPLAERMP